LGRALVRNWARAAVLTCGVLLLFFTYGHVYSLAKDWTVAGLLIGRHRVLLPLWGVLLAAWIALVTLKIRKPEDATRVLLVAGAVLIVMPTYTILRQEFSAWNSRAAEARTTAANSSPTLHPSIQDLPDIYYIILDAYGRSDVLRQTYGLDNSDFIRFLESRGFYVASEARSNYPYTILSLASSLNMTLLDSLAPEMSGNCDYKGPLGQMIRHSQVRQVLEGLGYQTVAFETGFPTTEIRDADLFLAPKYDQITGGELASRALSINAFERLLAETTLLRPIIDSLVASQNTALAQIDSPYTQHRIRVLYELTELPVAVKSTGPKFVFAHIVSPHPPFLFGRSGEVVPQTKPFKGLWETIFTRDEYISGYRDQAAFISSQMEIVIDKILAHSNRTPIIIIQGDHGPGADLLVNPPTSATLLERIGILDAYLLPGGKNGALYPSITPINSFRVVFNTYFGAGYPLVPDESYYAPSTCPYDLTRVTDRVVSGG
jgi:hypothetical protein